MATRSAMQLIRLVGGLALLAAAPLQLGATVIDPDTFDSRPLVNPLETPSHVLYWVAYLLTIVGLPAVHELQATRVGRVGAAGFLLALAGLALTMTISIIVAHLLPLLASSTGGAANITLLVMPGSVLAPLLPVLVLVAVTFFPGFILLGVATARAGVFPGWSGWLLSAGAVATLEATIDGLLDAMAQGMEQGGNRESGGHNGDVGGLTDESTQQELQRDDQSNIDQGQHGCQCAVDQGAVNDEINIPEP